ncbi:hypothetical protein [Catenuloplanes japonicus]|uniref:hypothetical protein n=1 Tax=Catenuloplanes japonicus TaxID=33876 RepID=UPI000524E1BC|nr:hypothetical protein [Catenuloplanes japonicus]
MIEDATVSAGWMLAAAFQARAATRGVTVGRIEEAGPPVLRWSQDGRPHRYALPGEAAIRRATVRAVITAVIGSIRPAGARVTGTVLVPAAGCCEPAGAGPVNAVRLLSPEVLTDPVEAWLAALAVQHTRCWTFSLTVSGPGLHGALLRSDGDVRALPTQAATDTARAVDLLAATSAGSAWPGVHLLRLSSALPDSCHVELVCGDTPVLDLVLERLSRAPGAR